MNIFIIAVLGFLVDISGQSPQGTARTKNLNRSRISAQKCETYKDLIHYENVTNFICSSWQYDNPKCFRTTRRYTCNEFSTSIVYNPYAEAGLFPHAAAIGWKDSHQNVKFKCGGSLISENFVLTVAHCAADNYNPPSIVRLGDQNLESDTDGAEPKKYDIKRFIKHEDYDPFSKLNDIGLIELKTNVQFSKFIRPVCLQQSDRHSESMTAIGWGLTGSQKNKLMKAVLRIVPMSSCNDGDLSKSQFCAEGIQGVRTCNIDSGGAIQVSHEYEIPCFYNMVGLTSYGSFNCSPERSSIYPSSYTKVFSYLDWIEQIVWP